MKYEVFPSELKGKVEAPGSKSIAQRMVACALLAKGETTLINYPDSDDCKMALQVAQSLGAIVTSRGNDVIIKGGFPNSFHAGIRTPKEEINCGESGLSSRMFTPIAALYDKEIKINGSGSLLQRPFSDFEKLLPQLGAECRTNKGLLPLYVKGPLQSGNVEIEAGQSSQFLTGVILALPKTSKKSKLNVSKLTSRPYIDMTIEVAAQFGVKIKHHNYEEFNIDGLQNYQPISAVIPGDWSGASFLMVAGALCATEGIFISNIDHKITQADNAIIKVLKQAGVYVEELQDGVKVYASPIKSFEFDATDCPDLFPPIVALAAFADGVSSIKGTKRLTYKESNRAKTLQEEFGKAGVRIVVRDDEMKVYPGYIRSAVINSHNDHRIAMAAAILGLAGDKITIRGAECVSKSFPDYFERLITLGANIQK